MHREKLHSFEEESTNPLAPETWSVREACRLLQISTNTGYKGAREGWLPVVHLGRVLRVPKAALRKLLQGGSDV
jgi:excisionase family DNA binding protein